MTERQSVADSAQPYLAAAAAAPAEFRPDEDFLLEGRARRSSWPTFRQAFEWALPMKA